MNAWKFSKSMVVALLIVLLLAALWLMLAARQEDKRIEAAHAQYVAGEVAKTIDARRQAFNQALDLYLALEHDYHPQLGDGLLYYNIGNTYYQLGQYPWAILYYQRALALAPRSEKVWHNLTLAQEKLALTHAAPTQGFANVFAWHSNLSLPERLQLFFVCGICCLLFCSFYIWHGREWMKRGALISLMLCFMLLLSVGYTRYLSPLQGVVVRAVELRRDAGMQYATVRNSPVPAGVMVEILSLSADGQWYKMLAPEGDLGYAPLENIRLIEF